MDGVDDVDRTTVVLSSVVRTFGFVVVDVVEDMIVTDELTCSDVCGTMLEIEVVVLVVVEKVERTIVVPSSLVRTLGAVVVVADGVEDVIDTDELVCSEIRGCVLEIEVVTLSNVDDVERTAVVASSLLRTLGVVVVVTGVVEDVVETDELTCSDV